MRFISIVFTSLLLSTPAIASPGNELVVVIDAGHGGTHRGALGAGGVDEKSVVLRAARLLRKRLGRLKGVRVVMTRERDHYLTLSQRVRIANAAAGKLFISLHCNASRDRTQRGFEVFVQSPAALDKHPAGWNAPTTTELTTRQVLNGNGAARLSMSSALSELLGRGWRRQGLGFGRHLIAALAARLGNQHNRGLREAGFDVLAGLHMPAVLVEMGFIDHAIEGPEVITASYLRKVTSAVVTAIARFQKTRPAVQGRMDPTWSAPRRKQHRRKDRRRPDPTQRPVRFRPRKPEMA